MSAHDPGAPRYPAAWTSFDIVALRVKLPARGGWVDRPDRSIRSGRRAGPCSGALRRPGGSLL